MTAESVPEDVHVVYGMFLLTPYMHQFYLILEHLTP
jgi:hypothetical protein